LHRTGTFAVPIFTVTNAAEIGARHDAATGYFSGNLDDVRIYDRVLTAGEAASLDAGNCPAAASGDLGITKTGSGTVKRGSGALYSIVVSNAGPDAATGAVVTDIVPAGVTYVAAQ